MGTRSSITASTTLATVMLGAASCATLAGIDEPTPRADGGADGGVDVSVPTDGAHDGNDGAGSCTDGIKNGRETDRDCGGGTCPACASGQACFVPTDCAGGVCTSNVCGDDAGLVDGGSDAGCVASTAPTKSAMYLSDPAPTFTSTATAYVLHKELNAYGNYGAADGQADILYNVMDVGAWTFSLPAGNVVSATVVLSMAVDDGNAPTNLYSFRLWSGACQYDSVGQLLHGTPRNMRFNDWTPISFPASVTAGSTFTVTVQNTSQTGSTGFTAIDWIELRVATQ